MNCEHKRRLGNSEGEWCMDCGEQTEEIEGIGPVPYPLSTEEKNEH